MSRQNLTAEQAHAYLERWRRVREVEVELWRKTSFDQRLVDLETLRQRGDAFRTAERHVEAARALWTTLRKRLG